jgi:hypothetical protein
MRHERNWWGVTVESFEASDARLVIRLFQVFVGWSSYALSRLRSCSAVRFRSGICSSGGAIRARAQWECIPCMPCVQVCG